MGPDFFFFFRFRNTSLFASFDAFQKPSHVSAQNPHGLHAFQILFDFFGGIAVNHVPVAGCDDGHAFDGKILVDFIKGCCRTGTSAADDSSANFSAEISAVKSSVQERNQGTCRRSEVYGCTEYKAVCISSFFKEFVDTVVAEASVRFLQ